MRADVVLAVVLRRDKVLMLNRKNCKDGLGWVFPGGKIESGESPDRAGIREVFEEAGISCKTGAKVIAERLHPMTKQHVVYVQYKYGKGECRVREPDKFTQATWLTPEQLESEIGTSIYPPVLATIQSQARHYRKSECASRNRTRLNS